MYSLRVTLFPAAGKQQAAQQLVTEDTKKRQAKGQRIALSASVVGERSRLIVTIFHEDLAAFEKFRRADQSDAAFTAYLAKLQPLLSGPPELELFEILIPLQA